MNFLKKVSLNLFANYKHTQSKIHDLTYLFWECTLRCNNNCLHCGSDCTTNNSIKDMPLKNFLEVLDQIKTKYNSKKIMVVLTGGEPLMRNDLEICGAEIYKREFPWGIVSNGYSLTNKKIDGLLKAGLHSLTISLDGLEANHNWLRGKKDGFKNAINAINYASRFEHLTFDVVTCVNQKNFNELKQIKELLIKSGVKQWRLFTIFPKGRAKDNDLLDISNKQFVELMEFIKQTRIEGKIKANYGCEGFLGDYEGEVRDSYFFCRAGINAGSVLVDGSISSCPSLREDYIQGNIYKDNFLDV